MNRLLERMFENRGYGSDFLDNILLCNHAIPLGVKELCDRLDEYRNTQKLIVLLTDFDFDGICSGIIGYGGLSELGFRVALYKPDVTKGYGFGPEEIDDIVSQFPDVRAILTADVGISAFKGIAYAKALGLDVFVTDHHKGDSSSKADVIVDPCRDEDENSYAYICGANVMYQVLRYYAEHYMPLNCGYYIEQIDRLRVFAGFGTISDSMPLYHENRPIVMDAVHICRMIFANGEDSVLFSEIPGCNSYQCIFYGLRAMLMAYKEAGKIKSNKDITETFFGYYVAPMFNSIKRMGGLVENAYLVFFGSEIYAHDALEYLFDLNEQRKVLVADKLKAMLSMNQPWFPYVYLTDAPGGICGLLAQQVISLTGMPTFVVHSDGDGYSGSGRCPVWLPFLQVGLPDGCSWWAAGHDVAFGFGCDSDDSMDAMVSHLESLIQTHKPSDDDLEVKPDFVISEFGDGDADLDIPLLSNYVRSKEQCRPFGSGFASPNTEFRFAARSATWHVIGKDHNHLKIVFPNGVNAMAFSDVEKIEAIVDPNTFDVDVTSLPKEIVMHGDWEFNDFNDIITLQFIGHIVNLGDDYKVLESEDVD